MSGMSQATITALNKGARKGQFAPWGGSPVKVEGGEQKGKTTAKQKKQKKS
ncbi:MAG: hypothetical protein HQ402_01110 [Parcubacteria group bacterium]|nr:hypothetical protein [Parcubacteria group bacterium]